MKDQEDKMSSMKSKISELLNEKESLSNELETSHLELETKKKYYEATIKKGNWWIVNEFILATRVCFAESLWSCIDDFFDDGYSRILFKLLMCP